MNGGSLTRVLADHETLRALIESVRASSSTFALSVEDDPELLEPVEEPFTSVEDVRDRLGRLEARLVDNGDRRSVFLTVYTEMTDRTIRAIEAGTFHDAEWMRRYLIRFAEYYRRAFVSFQRGAFEAVPDPWIVAFGAAVRGDTLVVQDAFLGINAHILYDLALTLTDVGIDPNRARKYTDHRRIDGILERLVGVQRELLAEQYAPGLSRIGTGMRGLDERWAGTGLRHAREKAWRIAVVRTDARLGIIEASTERLLRRSATGSAYLLLRPNVRPSAMEILRDVEADRFDLESYVRTFHERAAAEMAGDE
ncbi:DUF5995 family protein [Halorubrum vacuolatum]|uniref:Uncharacterized protein n=1 Tax=Halorubrum vacuolatum TaxID=63740 RepID=A0A238WHJ9_HALVU|nr:DUF5995 family protein [Halorubrum vacuolatum]SNR45724.1 hypothetical protein SAMN06264855_107144 [Halorubrum vacuolatum]